MPRKKNIKKNATEGEIEFVECDEDRREGSKTDIALRLKKELKQCQKDRQEYLDGWQRSKADFINARKEEEKHREEFIKFAKVDILTQILPVIDSFELAFANKTAWESVSENWRKGVEYIYSQLLNTLEQNGLLQINPHDVLFDPHAHSSHEIVSVDSNEDDGKVVEVLQKGYSFYGKIIRPARVKVGEYKKKNHKS